MTDAAFEINADVTSKLGVMVLMVDKMKRCNTINCRSTKSRRVTKSMFAAGIFAAAQGFD